MRKVLFAEFAREADFVRALKEAHGEGVSVIDAFAPFLPPEAETPHDPGARRITLALALGGILAGGAFYLLEWWSASVAYPFDSGARPANSWPTFIMGPFEFGVFAAALCGFIAWLIECRLPQPHHPLFESRLARRVTQDRYLIALKPGEAAETFARTRGATALLEGEL